MSKKEREREIEIERETETEKKTEGQREIVYNRANEKRQWNKYLGYPTAYSDRM
jgi:hypothetical protein